MVIRRYGLAMCLSIPLTTLGCGSSSISPQDRRHLDSALDSYKAGDDRSVVRHTEAVLCRATTGRAAMRAYYLRGMAYYRLKEYAASERDLERVYQKTRSTDLYVKSADTLGELAYLRGELALAAGRLREVLDKAPRGQRPRDHAHFRLGCILQRQGRWKDADGQFEPVVYYFPDSSLARLARQRSRGRAWTIQAGSYEKKQNADTAAEKFREAGLKDSSIEPVVRDGKRVFLLQVGRWDRYDLAEAKLASVRRIKTDAFLHVMR